MLSSQGRKLKGIFLGGGEEGSIFPTVKVQINFFEGLELSSYDLLKNMTK